MDIVGMGLFITFMIATLALSVKLALNTRGIVKNVIKVNYQKGIYISNGKKIHIK